MDDHPPLNETEASSGSPRVPLPVRINPYGDFGELLGQGGMGVVYRVRSRLEERDVALKVMRPDLARRDPEAHSRFLREARALSQVRHENVVEIFYVGEAAGVPYFVMPLLIGETLQEYLDRHHEAGTLPPVDDVIRIGREIAAGLAAAHAQGLIHRDVKPSNVWLEAPNGRVKLLDFGLARPTMAGTDHSAQTVIAGTPPYMSPEQFAGGLLDQRSDLFSLGTVLYQLATGERPFQADRAYQLRDQVANHCPESAHQVNPAIPSALSELIEQLHAKTPADRPASAVEVARRLDAIAASMRPGLLSRRAIALASGGLLLGGVAAALAWAWRSVPVAPVRSLPQFDLDVTLWKAGQFDQKGERPWTPGVLPLGPGDAVRLEAKSDRPVYFYLVWLQAGGKLASGYPWQNDAWRERLADEKPVQTLMVPSDADTGFMLEGPASGIEAFVLLARDEPLPPEDDLRPLLTSWTSTTDQAGNLAVAAWLENGKQDTNPLRGGSFAVQAKVNNTIGKVRVLTQTLFEKYGLPSRAVCFGYRGE